MRTIPHCSVCVIRYKKNMGGLKNIKAFVLFMAFSLLVGCSNDEEAPKHKSGFLDKLFKSSNRAVPVTVANALLRERALDLAVPAKLSPSETVEIKLPFEASIEQVFITSGDTIAVNTALVRLAEEELQLKLTQLRTELKDADNELQKNRYLHRNRDRLLEEGSINQHHYETLETQVERNEAAVEQKRSDIQSLQSRLTQLTITSPTSGVITEINVASGLTIPTNTTLMKISKVDPMIVEFELAGHEATAIQSGQKITVRFAELPTELIEANVISIGAVLEQGSTFPVKAVFANPTALFKVGMQAEVKFTGVKRQRYFLVPNNAILIDQRQHYVFVVVQGAAHRTRIIPKQTQDGFTEVVEGLREDDLIIVKGHEKLEEGTTVDIWGR